MWKYICEVSKVVFKMGKRIKKAPKTIHDMKQYGKTKMVGETGRAGGLAFQRVKTGLSECILRFPI